MAGDSSSPTPTSAPVVVGETIRHVSVGRTATFEIIVPGFNKDAIDINLIGPSKRPCPFRLVEGDGETFRLEFSCTEVGSYVSDITIGGRRLADGPLIAKAYNSALIHVSDVTSGVVGQPCQFRVDASQAGEGQLEISINEGELPNHVQVLGGGRCLVGFTPEASKSHSVDIRFNGETVPGCPFEVRVGDPSHFSVDLRSLELIPVGQTARFHITVDTVSSAELAVSVRGPSADLPVKVSGNVRSGFVAEFVPREVGSHSVLIEANGASVAGTPFVSKAYDAKKVVVGALPRGAVRRPLQFTVDASEAGEGNLEITITARGRNVATQVHPQGSARFTVGFVPSEAVDHNISVSFNKEAVPGSPFTAEVQGDPHRIGVSGQGLSAAAVNKSADFTVSNVTGTIEDLEVNVEGPGGSSVPAQVSDSGDKVFRVEFCPRLAGEHRIFVNLHGSPVGGSPFHCRVYDVSAIRVNPTDQGVVGRPVTFIVETMDAGPGNLEVTVNDGQVATSAQAQGPHIYAISFTPKEAGSHVLQLRFNGEAVPGSPFSCEVSEAARVAVSGDVEKVAVGRPARIVAIVSALQDGEGFETPKVSVTSPSRQPLDTKIIPEGSGRFFAEFTPTEVGDHTVELQLGEESVAGSPFVIKSYDPSKVRVTDVAHGVAGRPLFFSIDASQAGAGNLEIIVSVSGKNVPNFVQAEGNARFKVNFKPQEAANHLLSVKFNGEAVPGSPFTCKVRAAGQVALGGPAFKMAALGKPALLTVDPRGADVSECVLSVMAPSGATVPSALSGSPQSKFIAEFLPAEVGPHLITVLLDSDPVEGSPFTCNVYDVSKVKVTGLGTAKVGSPSTFTVDASEAGEGTLELVVTSGKVSVRAEVAARSRGLYDVTFVPQVAATHYVAISFNDEDVPGSAFPCNVLGGSGMDSHMVSASGEGLKKVQLGCPTSFLLDTHGMPGEIDVRIQGPYGEVPVHFHTLPSGLIRVEYTAQKIGTHLVSVGVVGRKPQTFHVDAFDASCITMDAPRQANVGKEVIVKVSTEGAGEGEVTASVRALGQTVPCALRSSPKEQHQHELLFTPQLPVGHKMDIRFNGVPVPGSPVSINAVDLSTDVGAKGSGLHACRFGQSASFIIYSQGSEEVDVVVSGSRGEVVPVRCYQQKDGNLLAQFQPQTAGTHKVEVTVGGKSVKGSPFFCQVYDPSCVHIEEIKTTSVAVGENIVFRVNREKAGFAELEVVVTSPLGRHLPLEVKGDGSREADRIEFTPSLPGKYKFDITFAGESVQGSPVTFLVEEEGGPRVQGPGLTLAQIGIAAVVRLDGRGMPGQPHIQVDGPENTVPCSLEPENEEGLWIAKYTPQEVGVFDVRIFWNGREIAGSPYHPRVVAPNKVRIIGGVESICNESGCVQMVLGQEFKVTLDTGEAGPGHLQCDLNGPSSTGSSGGAVCHTESLPPSRVRLSILPTEAGPHQLHLTFADFPIPDSPFTVSVIPAETLGGEGRVSLTGKGLAHARCGEEAVFIIDGSAVGAGGPEVFVRGPKGEPVPSLDIHQDGKFNYTATYIPVVSGTHLITVLWNGREVEGCPVAVAVTGGADASRVVCAGDGLRVAVVGKESRSFIDTRRAGPGELTAQCQGQRRPAYCELYDHGDGTFTLSVKAQEPGKHALHIKYGGEHVPGSPFPLRVQGAPDASKVRVFGPGIDHGVLATFQSRFVCDTRGAGAGQLTVRIRGPKGAFRVEMQRESQRDRSILCKYDPTEPGDYRVEVKWAGQHVPGSPFLIMIFDTQEELSRFLQGDYSPPPGNGISEMYGTNGFTPAPAIPLGQMSWRGSQAQL